jgi:hypothetical protein
MRAPQRYIFFLFFPPVFSSFPYFFLKRHKKSFGLKLEFCKMLTLNVLLSLEVVRIEVVRNALVGRSAAQAE